MGNNPLTDYGTTSVFYPTSVIENEEIKRLIIDTGYELNSDGFALINVKNVGRYLFIPRNLKELTRRDNFIDLDTIMGEIKIIYTQPDSKERNRQLVTEIEANIESCLNLDGE